MIKLNELVERVKRRLRVQDNLAEQVAHRYATIAVYAIRDYIEEVQASERDDDDEFAARVDWEQDKLR